MYFYYLLLIYCVLYLIWGHKLSRAARHGIHLAYKWNDVRVPFSHYGETIWETSCGHPILRAPHPAGTPLCGHFYLCVMIFVCIVIKCLCIFIKCLCMFIICLCMCTICLCILYLYVMYSYSCIIYYYLLIIV